MDNSLAFILEALTTDSKAKKKDLKAEAIKRGTIPQEFEASWKEAKAQLKKVKADEPVETKQEERFASRIKSSIIELKTKEQGTACRYDLSTKMTQKKMVFVQFKGETLDLTDEDFKKRFKFA